MSSRAGVFIVARNGRPDPRGTRFVKRIWIATTLASLILALSVQGTAHAAGTADLSVSVTPSASPVVATSALTYTITVTNKGPDDSEHTRITDTIPPDVMLVSSSGKGAFDSSTGVVSWYPGLVAANTAVTRTLTIRPIHPGTIKNTANASTSSSDPALPNTVQTTTVVNPEPGVHYVSVRGGTGFKPPFHSVALGETVQWDIYGAATDPPHDITDSHGLRLFDSGPLTPVNYFRYRFTLSGEVRTMDDPINYPDNTGKLVVPVQVSPTSGTQSDTYTITWATAPLPAGFVEDVQIKRHAELTESRWQQWRHGTSLLSDSFVPDAGPGTYAFRDRIRRSSNRNHSRFGPPVTIDVVS
jgi:uncharacterized repeat protein (TIGR01451 family)